jgi:Tfp pilus assembly protein PilN
MKTPEELLALIKANPVGFICAAVALAFGGAIYYRSSELPKATALLEQKSTEGARLAANVRNGAHLPDQSAAMAAAIKTIDSRLIRPGELAQNLQYFYKLETETGAKLVDLRQLTTTVPKTAKPGAAAGIGFTVTVEGEYRTLLDFLRRLEQGTHYCRIMSASIGLAGPERSSPLTLAIGVELLGRP